MSVALYTLCRQMQLLRLYTAVHSCEAMPDSNQFGTCCCVLPQDSSEAGIRCRRLCMAPAEAAGGRVALMHWQVGGVVIVLMREHKSSSMQLCSTRILQHLCLKALQLCNFNGLCHRAQMLCRSAFGLAVSALCKHSCCLRLKRSDHTVACHMCN